VVVVMMEGEGREGGREIQWIYYRCRGKRLGGPLDGMDDFTCISLKWIMRSGVGQVEEERLVSIRGLFVGLDHLYCFPAKHVGGMIIWIDVGDIFLTPPQVYHIATPILGVVIEPSPMKAKE